MKTAFQTREATAMGTHIPPASERSPSQICKKLGFPAPVDIGGGLSMCIGAIDRETASTILAMYHAPNNRPPKKHVVAMYARDMTQGAFALTHQGIAFSKEGLLFDGQHRMMAIVESDSIAEVVVCFGLDVQAIVNTDIGCKRSVSDLSKFTGGAITKDEAAIVRKIIRGPDGMAISPHEILGAAEPLRPCLEFLKGAFPSKIKKVTNAPIVGAIGRAYYHVDRDRLLQFCQVLREGIATNANEDMAAVLLYRFAMNATCAGEQAGREMWLKAQSAISSFCERRFIKKLYEADRDLYVLPEAIQRQVDR